jgi:hypothetical protein
VEFHIDAGVDGCFVWRALDEDGVELACSPPLATREACVRAVLAMKVEAAGGQIFDLSARLASQGGAPAPARSASRGLTRPGRTPWGAVRRLGTQAPR